MSNDRIQKPNNSFILALAYSCCCCLHDFNKYKTVYVLRLTLTFNHLAHISLSTRETYKVLTFISIFNIIIILSALLHILNSILFHLIRWFLRWNYMRFHLRKICYLKIPSCHSVYFGKWKHWPPIVLWRIYIQNTQACNRTCVLIPWKLLNRLSWVS